jgi:cytochrome c oxidase subunit 1
LFGVFAGTYFWFPKMFGRMMNESLGKWHFGLTFVGVYCVFMPMHYLGLVGNVRRYSAFVDDYLAPLIPVHKFITVAALITGGAQLIFFWNVLWSRFRGSIASENPWQATSLEWSTSSPPPFDNFGGHHPVVNNGPNEIGVATENGTDFVMQTAPPGAV